MIKNKTIKKYLDILDDRSKDILILRFGLDGNKPQTLEQVGKKYQITRERIRQIQFLAMAMIDKEREKIRLTDEELKLIQDAMEYYGSDKKYRSECFNSVYEKLEKMYKEK